MNKIAEFAVSRTDAITTCMSNSRHSCNILLKFCMMV